MRSARLVLRGLAYYWRSHAAVVLGVACAVSALAGALLVGDSVRASLRELFLQRLGRADHALVGGRFFREALAAEVVARPGFAAAFRDAAPLLILEGVVTHEASGRRASRVSVYGVDERFWRFHELADAGLSGRGVLASVPLADELAAAPGDALLLRVPRASDIPAASLYGRRDDPGLALRTTLERVRPARELGEFSLRAQQQPVLALFVPLRLLQRTLEREAQVNALLLAEARSPGEGPRRHAEALPLVRASARLEDLGLRLRPLASRHALSLESATGLLEERTAAAARAAAGRLGLSSAGYLTYLANSIRAHGRAIPYSLVTAREAAAADTAERERRDVTSAPPIWLNDWAARDLGAVAGDRVVLDYFVWLEAGRLETRTAEFELAGSLPLTPATADPDLTPEYPGISGSARLSDWDPPFPLSLAAIRPKDEEYWERFRTTPKAFVDLSDGQSMWRHRLGSLTSLRVSIPPGVPLEAAERGLRAELARELDPSTLGLRVDPVRANGLAASEGATDFGEYFAYFSAFLWASALLLAGLFFRLGVEQRRRELGLLRSVGFPARRVLLLFMAEGLALAVLGSLLGLVGAAAAGELMVLGLRTIWSGALGTRELQLHVTGRALALGGAGGLAAAALVMALTLRGLRRVSPQALLAGRWEDPARWTSGARRARAGILISLLAAGALLLAAAAGRLSTTPAFFASGTLLLCAALLQQWRWLAARRRGGSAGSVIGLGFRNAAHRPGRSLLCIALIASATFVIMATGAFRRQAEPGGAERRSGTGGYALLAETLLPLHHDPGSAEGRAALNLGAASLEGVAFARFRLRPGEDASCLNLYRPQDPRLLGVTPEFVREGRFDFQASLAETAEERANPWLLLERPSADAVPAIADASSLAYVLHLKLGDELIVEREGRPVRLRFVAALRDSIFQGELLVAERRLLEAFPEIDGYRVLLVDAPAERAPALAAELEARLAGVGLDATDAAARLAAFHRVENTYLATFETLGGLGLLLGTVGLATVLLRNALERRRELALLRAVGFRPDHLVRLVVAENALLLLLGLATGAGCALAAIAPALAARGGRFPWLPLLGLLGTVLVTGLAASSLAAGWVRRAPLLGSLRAE